MLKSRADFIRDAVQALLFVIDTFEHFAFICSCAYFPYLADINRMLWILIKLLIMPLVMGIGYEFIKYAGKHDNLLVKILSAPGLWMQRINNQRAYRRYNRGGIEAIKAVLTDNPEDDEIK